MKHPDAQPAPERYRGMTVNERLMVAGLRDPFDAAVRRGDRPAMISLLGQLELDEKQAISTTDTLLANPKHYGY